MVFAHTWNDIMSKTAIFRLWNWLACSNLVFRKSAKPLSIFTFGFSTQQINNRQPSCIGLKLKTIFKLAKVSYLYFLDNHGINKKMCACDVKTVLWSLFKCHQIYGQLTFLHPACRNISNMHKLLIHIVHKAILSLITKKNVLKEQVFIYHSTY